MLQPDDAWTGDLAGHATSLAARTGEPVAVPTLAGRVVGRWRAVLAAPSDSLTHAELDAYRDRDALAGATVTVDGESGGVVQGVAADGALVLADARGRARRVRSGTVRAVDTDSGERR